MTRADLQRLAKERVRDVKVLLAAKRWSLAYYAAGYIVEYALKACIIKSLMTTDKFPERRFSERCWTHDLAQLVSLAGLDVPFEESLTIDPDFSANWTIVSEWEEGSRYLRTSRVAATRLFQAITETKHGVLPWIERRW